jgi:hypothetical protein
MIDELDEVLRNLMVRELPIKNNEVDVAFHQPKKDWSSRVSKPTLNFYLYDIRENNKLRQPSPAFMSAPNAERKNSVVQRRHPIRLDLHYMVTAWATEPDDEHRLLTRAIMVLYRIPEIPQDLLPETIVADQQGPIFIKAAQYDTLEKPTDVWSVMDNQMRPSIPCVITMSVNPYTSFVTPLVQTIRIKLGTEETIWIKGTVRSKQPLDNLRVTLVERGIDAYIKDNLEFAFQNMQPGSYTLEANAAGIKPVRRKITVPADEYDIEV